MPCFYCNLREICKKNCHKNTINEVGQVRKVQSKSVLDVGPGTAVKLRGWCARQHAVFKLGASVLQQQADGLSQLEEKQ